MDIATEEFSHLEIVGATIQMLLTGINGDLKDAANNSEIMQLLDGKAAKEDMIHKGMVAPQFFIGTAVARLIPTARECHGPQHTLTAMYKAILHRTCVRISVQKQGQKWYMNTCFSLQMIRM